MSIITICSSAHQQENIAQMDQRLSIVSLSKNEKKRQSLPVCQRTNSANPRYL